MVILREAVVNWGLFMVLCKSSMWAGIHIILPVKHSCHVFLYRFWHTGQLKK